ncbi:hypothetical protein GCM10027180_35580 [Microbulbifer echini]
MNHLLELYVNRPPRLLNLDRSISSVLDKNEGDQVVIGSRKTNKKLYREGEI